MNLNPIFICFCLCFAKLLAETPPNVVIFFVDGKFLSVCMFVDMGYADLGCQGNKTVSTPNIDNMASEGVRFTQWLSGDSICTPSRGALLTGRLPVRLGLASGTYISRVFMPLSPHGLPLEEHTLAEALKERGYSTQLSGKWHLGIGKDNKYLPQSHGFDNFYGMGVTNVQSCMPGKKVYTQSTIYEFIFLNTYHVWLPIFAANFVTYLFGTYSSKTFSYLSLLLVIIFFITCHGIEKLTLISSDMCILYKDNEIIQQPVNLYNLTQRVTHDATKFISQSVEKDNPFFLYLSYHKMHTALFSNDEFKTVDESERPEFAYVNNLRELDWSVGYVIDELKRLGIYENTILWFTSDNGPFLERGVEGGSKKFLTTDSNGNEVMKQLRGGKTTIWEGGFRVPGIAVYKNRFPSSIVTDEPVGTMDIFPTTIRLVDDKLNSKKSMTFSNTKPHTLIDGKDITDMVVSLGSDSPKNSPHEAMIHYCGDVLSAVRIKGHYKAYFYTPIFTEEEEETCSVQSACQCNGNYVTHHSPPLLFDLKKDIEEKVVLTKDNFDNYENIMSLVNAAVKEHKKTLKKYPNRDNVIEALQDITLYPQICCNFPSCSCDKDPYTQKK